MTKVMMARGTADEKKKLSPACLFFSGPARPAVDLLSTYSPSAVCLLCFPSLLFSLSLHLFLLSLSSLTLSFPLALSLSLFLSLSFFSLGVSVFLSCATGADGVCPTPTPPHSVLKNTRKHQKTSELCAKKLLFVTL